MTWNSLMIHPCRDRSVSNRRYYIYRKYRLAVESGLCPPIEDILCMCGHYIPVEKYRVHKQSCG